MFQHARKIIIFIMISFISESVNTKEKKKFHEHIPEQTI